MQIKCPYCMGSFEDTESSCPHCGAANENIHRFSDGIPKTIEELKAWYNAMHLPPEQVTRIFIGKDIKEPKTFGVYKDGDEYIVYKNKADGTRAVRYRGIDEAYAVNELYLKIKELVAEQKARQNHTPVRNAAIHRPTKEEIREQNRRRFWSITFPSLVALLIPLFCIVGVSSYMSNQRAHSGYATVDGNTYYKCYTCNKWYEYTGDDYELVDNPTGEIVYYGQDPDDTTLQTLGVTVKHEDSKAYRRAHPKTPESDYYSVNGVEYYYLGGWYWYNTDDAEWETCPDRPIELQYDFDDYVDEDRDAAKNYDGIDDANVGNVYSFTDTDYWSDYWESSNSSSYDSSDYSGYSSSDWDSDSSWSSSDSWDSGSTNWDSDW